MFELIANYRTALANRARAEDGATAVEYGLMVALIAVIIIAAVAALGGVLNTAFDNTCDSISLNTGGSGDCVPDPAATP